MQQLVLPRAAHSQSACRQQEIETTIMRLMPELVVNVLMTLQPAASKQTGHFSPPDFSLDVVRCTLAYISSCHGAKSLVSGMAKYHQVLYGA